MNDSVAAACAASSQYPHTTLRGNPDQNNLQQIVAVAYLCTFRVEQIFPLPLDTKWKHPSHNTQIDFACTPFAFRREGGHYVSETIRLLNQYTLHKGAPV